MESVSTATDKQNVLTYNVIKLCRKFKILLNERTTIVTHNEEMQILQYCSALHNKQICGKFDTNAKVCEKIYSKMMSSKISMLESKFCSNSDNALHDDDKDGKRDLTTSSHIESKSEKECSSIEEEVSGTKWQEEMKSHNDGMPHNVRELDEKTDIEKETLENNEEFSSVTSLFVESLRSSNHVTFLEVYEKFLNEIVNKESRLHMFVKSDFGMDMSLSEDHFLRKVEILAMSVLNRIAKANDPEEDKPRCQILQTSQETKEATQHENGMPDDESSAVMSVLSSPSIVKGKTTPQRLRSVKTPVQAFKSKHHLSPSMPITPRTDLERQQVQKKFIENIFRCYIHVLVNTRCELALAFIFNIPERELNHEAFTHLKHESAATGLSMYQTLSSMLMRVRLGGHGYAPPADSPLLSYIKGLGCLLDFIDKLQTVIEESISPRSGCKRVVNILKRNISMCKSRRFPSSVVESVASELWESMDDVLSVMEKGNKNDNSEDLDSQEAIVMGQESIDAFQKYLDYSSICVSDVDHYLLGDVRFSQDTPTRFPSLMSRFRSPLPIVEEEQEEMDGEFTKINSEGSKRSVWKVSEAMCFDNEVDKIPSTPLDFDNVYIIPSKTIVHPKCGADYGETSENLFSPVKKLTNQKDKKKCGPTKRKKKGDASNVNDKGKENSDENSPQSKSMKNCDVKSMAGAGSGENTKSKGVDVNKKQNKSCRRKLLSQIKGQSKITGFFKK